jgi:nucleoside-diphosphate-sugar epimerase
MLSLFGKGFIGSKFCEIYQNEVFVEERSSLIPKYSEILYLRGTTSNYNVFSDPSKDVKDNLLLFTETLKNLNKDSCFNLASSWFVFGTNNKSQNEKMCETDFCNPKGFYSITKLCQEQLLESYCRTFNLNYRIFRLCNVVGGDQNANAKKNALEFLIQKLKNNEEISVYTGDNYRNYLHVKDVCRAMKLIMEKGNHNEIYNIGAINSLRLIDIIEYCKDRLASTSEIKIIPQPDFHKQVQVLNFHMDISKLSKLGFIPEYNMTRIMDELCSK